MRSPLYCHRVTLSPCHLVIFRTPSSRARRQRLIQHFGGLQGLSRAGVEDLQRVPGISRALAQRIHDLLHQ